MWKFAAVLRFADYREYFAHVLGGHAYEHADHLANLFRNFNGTHSREPFPDVAGSRRHLVQLRLRPTEPGKSDAAAAATELTEQALPEVNEAVKIKLVYDQAIGEEVTEHIGVVSILQASLLTSKFGIYTE